jgi:hypothetical protein
MNDINSIIRATSKPLLKFYNLPEDRMTEEQVAELLWQKIGINVEPSSLSVKGRMCFAALTPESLADFFSRALQGSGLAVTTFDMRGEPKRK